VVRYGAGYSGPFLHANEDGQPEFSALIPDGRTEKDVLNLIRTPRPRRDGPPKIVGSAGGWPVWEGGSRWPTWEVGARDYGEPWLTWPKIALASDNTSA